MASSIEQSKKRSTKDLLSLFSSLGKRGICTNWHTREKWHYRDYYNNSWRMNDEHPPRHSQQQHHRLLLLHHHHRRHRRRRGDGQALNRTVAAPLKKTFFERTRVKIVGLFCTFSEGFLTVKVRHLLMVFFFCFWMFLLFYLGFQTIWWVLSALSKGSAKRDYWATKFKAYRYLKGL